MKTSLKLIAETLKLSKTTISWVLSGKGSEKGISEDTQRKVWECAKRLHYQPNLLARSLHTGKSSTIGLIIPDITDSFYSKVARAIEMEAEEQGYSLMICSSESDVERENRMIRLFKAKQVDGIIIAPTKKSQVEIKALMIEKYPFVLFDRFFPELDTDYVIIDNENTSYRVVNGMIKSGAKKVALITTNSHLYTMWLRGEGYRRALQEAGIGMGEQLVGEVKFDHYEEEINYILDEIFAHVPDVDGFFFTTHILALEAFRYFSERNIDISKGYELGCIHRVSAFRALAPRMHIARMPIQEIGEQSVQILIDRIHDKQNDMDVPRAIKHVMLPCHF